MQCSYEMLHTARYNTDNLRDHNMMTSIPKFGITGFQCPRCGFYLSATVRRPSIDSDTDFIVETEVNILVKLIIYLK